MKKIMFNDKYGLTAAVLGGRKTMTRRLVKSDNIVSITTSDGAVHHVDKTYGSYHEYMDKDGKVWLAWSPYKVGEIVAVAQNYQDAIDNFNGNNNIAGWGKLIANTQNGGVGYYNKMFTRADLMPHHIRITNIRLERLQDISDKDCIREGLWRLAGTSLYHYDESITRKGRNLYHTPREAFAALIDKVSGKGTWDSNPWVFAYSFKKID